MQANDTQKVAGGLKLAEWQPRLDAVVNLEKSWQTGILKIEKAKDENYTKIVEETRSKLKELFGDVQAVTVVPNIKVDIVENTTLKSDPEPSTKTKVNTSNKKVGVKKAPKTNEAKYDYSNTYLSDENGAPITGTAFDAEIKTIITDM